MIKRIVKFTYDFHRLLRGSYRAFPYSYFTFHIITSTGVKKKRNGERVSLIKSTIFVTSSVAGHAQTDFGVFPFTAETRVARCVAFAFFLSSFFFLLLQRFSLSFLLRLFSPPRKTTSLRSTQHYRDDAGYRPLRISCAIIRERHHGCRHLSIHSHLLSDVH